MYQQSIVYTGDLFIGIDFDTNISVCKSRFLMKNIDFSNRQGLKVSFNEVKCNNEVQVQCGILALVCSVPYSV